MKVCSICKENKDESYFHKGASRCKACSKIYSHNRRSLKREEINAKRRESYKQDPLHVKEINDRSRKKNKVKVAQTKAEWKRKNPDKVKVSNEKYAVIHLQEMRRRRIEWNDKNRHVVNASTAKRRAARIQATPKWLSREQLMQIQEFYKISTQLTRQTGIVHSVDHIIPLQGENVSGLHVPWNLRVVPLKLNQIKSNKVINE